MKSCLVLCFLAFVASTLVDATPVASGCIYVMGRCHSYCPDGTHSYAMGCGNRVPEATCDEPNPVAETSIMCDYSSCYCDSPNVRDTQTNKCVPLDQCPGKKVESNKI